MDLLLETEGTWKKGNAFAVPDLRAKVEADGDSNPEFRVTLTDGTLLINGSSQRWGDCEGPVKLGGSAYIRCYVALQGLEVSYRKGDFFSQITTGRVNVRAMANLLDSKAEVEFRHFNGNQTEEVRVSVDEVDVHLTELGPRVPHHPQWPKLEKAVRLKMNETMSDLIPEILADHLVLAMGRVNFPLPK
ncbi:uncharacterized protein ISCGN_021359 [Ixodes scapularis]